jgi:hypothetical protein
MQIVAYESGIIRVVDISANLPKHPNWPRGCKGSLAYRLDPNRMVNEVIWHHTAGGVQFSGVTGPIETASYCVKDPPKGRGYPGIPYHIYIPYAPEKTTVGMLIIYLTQPLGMWSWHTGPGHNEHGIGVAWQGRMISRHEPHLPILPGQTGHPSTDQWNASVAVWAWLKQLYKLSNKNLHGHFEMGKPACPGDDGEKWILDNQKVAD